MQGPRHLHLGPVHQIGVTLQGVVLVGGQTGLEHVGQQLRLVMGDLPSPGPHQLIQISRTQPRPVHRGQQRRQPWAGTHLRQVDRQRPTFAHVFDDTRPVRQKHERHADRIGTNHYPQRTQARG